MSLGSLKNNDRRGLNDGNSQPRTRRLVDKLWLWEIGACFLSLACLVSIVGVLIYEDGRELDQWTLFIPPNAVVSFIGTLAKSAFLLTTTETISQLKWLHFRRTPNQLSDLKLFDEASRGPWGSCKLFLSRHKNSALGSCAALVVVGSLFVDPFVQLVFSFPSRSVADSNIPVAFQQSELYDPSHYVRDVAGDHNEAIGVDLKMQAAILQAIYNPDIPSTVSCPTGNCGWTDVTTLGFCGSCQETSSGLHKACGVNNALLPEGYPFFQCNYTTPKNNTLSASVQSPSESTVYSWTRWNSTLAMNLDNPSPDFISFEAIQVPVTNETNSLPAARSWWCNMNFCAKTYSSVTVNNGGVDMQLSQTQTLKANEVYSQTAGATITDWLPLTPLSNSSQANGGNFTINQADYLNIENYLEQLFSTGWYSDGASTLNVPEVVYSTNDGQTSIPAVPPAGRALADSLDLNATINVLAISMTESIRKSANGTEVPGQAFVQKTFIQVQWGWLVLPLTLMASTFTLLIVVIWKTHTSRTEAWKADDLALLFHRVEGYSFDEVAHGRKAEDLKRIAKNMLVQLSPNGRMAFVKAE